MSSPPISRDLIRLITLRHIRFIVELEATRSLRDTAHNLGVSYAATSKTLIEIENLIGQRLFDRSLGLLIPTDICLPFITSAKRIQTEMNILAHSLWNDTTPLRGRVRIAFQAPAVEAYFAGWCSEVMHRQPDLRMSWEIVTRTDMFDGLEKGKYDIGIAGLSGIERWPHLSYKPVSADYYFFVSKSGVTDCDTIFADWDNYKDRVWILPLEGMAMREYFNLCCKELSLHPPRRMIEINSPIRVAEMIMHLDAMTMMTSSMWNDSHSLPAESRQSRYDARQGIIWNEDRTQKAETKFVLEVMLLRLENSGTRAGGRI